MDESLPATPMNDRWAAFAIAIESGEPDRVNDVINEVEAMDPGERVDLFDVCFEELTEIYGTAEDGYVRQSVARLGERLVPTIATVAAIENPDRTIDADAAVVRDQTDALCGFFLTAITDDDGRVRQSAKRGLEHTARTYGIALEDEESVAALADELERMATEHSDSRREHVLEARANVEYFLEVPLGRVVEPFEARVEESR